jgi:hypothetical protein
MAAPGLNDETLVPGDVVAFDFKILVTPGTVYNYAVKKIKDQIASDPRLDYQGSKIMTVGDVELKRDVDILRVFAQVRKTMRDTTQAPIQEANVAALVGYAVAGIGVALAAYVVFSVATKFMGASTEFVRETGQAAGPVLEGSAKLLFVAVLAFVAYLIFFRK